MLLANGEALHQQWLQLPNLPSSSSAVAERQANEGIVLPLDSSLSLEAEPSFPPTTARLKNDGGKPVLIQSRGPMPMLPRKPPT